MPLRPVTFYLPSSSSIQVFFSDMLKEDLSVQNFEIESLTGTSANLTIKSIEVNKNSVKINTNPQNARTYYLLRFKDSEEFPFVSKSGDQLINDKVSRTLYFVAAEDFNPVRDRMFSNLPNMYNLQGTMIEDLISSQAKEIHNSQRSVGELLSDNYLRVPINDEIRTRGGTSFDRMANENCFKVKRVSLQPTGNVPSQKEVVYTDDQTVPRHDVIDNIISLQEEIVEETITISKDNRYSDGLIIDLSKNIIKLLSAVLIDQDGIETTYNIDAFSYLINDNRYDNLARNFVTLEENQLIIPPMSNISNNKFDDKVKFTYLTKNKSTSLLEFFEASELVKNFREAIPTNTKSFYLEHYNVVNSSGNNPDIGGLTIRANQSSTKPPFEFSNEIKYETRVPSNPGEFSVNYETGEVLIFGNNGTGVGEESYYVQYNYKRILEQNLDYYIYNKEFVLNTARSVLNNKLTLKYNKENVFVEGVDYIDKTHVEVLNEEVGSNISTSFSILSRKSPIAQIFKIFNKTTGEIYNPLYAIDNKILFSGNRSPEIRDVDGQQVVFEKIFREELFSSITTINPAFVRTIVTATNPSNIRITPGIPSHLIDTTSEDYYIKDVNTGQDYQISYFGSGAMINTVAIKGTSLPSPLAQVHIGTKLTVINLEKDGIISTDNGIGSVLSSSISFDSDIIKTEKFFESSKSLSVNSNFNIPLVNSLSSDKIFQNIQRLRKVGDYGVDYENGILYLASPSSEPENYGYIDYEHKVIDNTLFNVLTVNDLVYENTKLQTKYTILNNKISEDKIIMEELPSHYEDYNGERAYFGSSQYETNTLLDSYEIITSRNILKLNGLYTSDSIYGKDVDSVTGPTITEVTSENKFDKNLNNFRSLVLDQNKIDLKYNEYFYAILDGSNLDIIISNPTASIIEILNEKTGKVICSQDLINRKEEVFFSGVNQSSGSFIISVIDPDVFNAIATGDFISNENGENFPITTFSSISKTISCTGTFSGEELFVSTQGTVSSTATETKISFDVNSNLEENVQFLVKYIDSNTPAIGTAFFVDYSAGTLEVSYSYVYDDIEISYEYGDNSLDWSSSNVLSEGENYYVSYEYGALRGALERNFANLVQLPYFQNFSLNKNREVFRDALEGALQSFSQGPLISSIENIVESITKTKPEVIEKFFGNWILGRSHLSENRIKYDGVLSYEPVKYDTGLYFKDDISVVAAAQSSVKLDSGSVCMFFKNKWLGLENDANIQVFLDQFGTYNFSYNTDFGYKSSENNVSVLNFLNSMGILSNPNVLRYSNYEYDPAKEDYVSSEFGFIKKIPSVNTLDEINVSFKNKTNILNLSNLNIKDGFVVSQFMFNDGLKSSLIENKIHSLGSYTETVFSPALNYFELEKLALTTKIKGSGKEFFDIFTKQINIKFSTPIDIKSILSSKNVGYKSVDNSNIFIHSDGYCYKISSFSYNGIKTEDVTSLVDEMFLDFLPINFDSMQTFDNIDKVTFGTSFDILCLKSEAVLQRNDYSLFGDTNNSLLSKYNDFSNISLSSHSFTNTFDISIDGKTLDIFWSDLYLTKDIKNYIATSYALSEDDAIELTKHRGFMSFTSCDTERIDSFAKDININVLRYLDQSKIYIGARGFNPNSVNFELSSKSPEVEGLKEVFNDGFYIGLVDSDVIDEKEKRSVWKIISSISPNHSLPSSVSNVNGKKVIKNTAYGLKITFSGKIIVDGDINLLEKVVPYEEIKYHDGY
jgi:hypothetical protein